jgi:glycosyltransferase involved in cell wall biosynthesis
MPRRLRIFHLIKGLGRGGAELLLEQSLHFGDRERFEYAFGYFLPWKDALVRPLRDAGAEVVCFEAHGNLAVLSSIGRVADHLRHWQADLVHCHLPLSGVVGRLAGRRAGVPVVYTEHNLLERQRALTRRLNLATWRFQERVIAVSSQVAASIAAWKDSSVPVVVVRNGVDPRRFEPLVADGMATRAALGIAADAPVVGTVALFSAKKRLHDWLAAARIVLNHQPAARFLLVGDGPLRTELHASAAALGIEHAVSFPGLQEDVRPYLAAMDVYLMTSIFEGLPVALLEAMAMGRAVVVTPVGGIPEVVRAGENGLIAEVGAPGAVASAVIELLDDPPRAKRLATAARSTIEERFSASTMVRRIESVYDEVLRAERG